MTLEQAKENAPSYFHAPDDGAPFRCVDCNELLPPSEMLRCFTPSGWDMWLCIDCVDAEWYNSAKDCGVHP